MSDNKPPAVPDNSPVSPKVDTNIEKEWYKKPWGAVIAFVLLPFFVIWYAWAKSSWSKGVKIAVTVIAGIFIIGFMGSDTEQAANTTTETAKSEVKTESPKEQPKPAEPEIKAPEPITLSGVGQQATGKFALTRGLTVFKMSHNGTSNWAPKLLDSEGETVELLANEIGVFNGSKAVNIERDGQYLIDVTASGNWTIVAEQPRVTNAPATRSFSGDSQQATALFSLEKGLKTVRMKHSGQGNFAPILLDKDGNRIALMANEIGPFDGSKAVRINRSGIYLIDVAADGPWSITLE